jgi:hypothetical protein
MMQSLSGGKDALGKFFMLAQKVGKPTIIAKRTVLKNAILRIRRVSR